MRATIPTSGTFNVEDRKLLFKTNGEGSHDDSAASATQTMLVGFDWGTNKSCVFSRLSDSQDKPSVLTTPTLVGYANDGIVENLLPGNARVLFGEQALKHRLHLRLVQPMIDGVVNDLSASRDFVKHVRSLINPPEDAELRAVIGLPANVGRSVRENLRQAVTGVFDRVILAPEPFLAALGYRDESRLNTAFYRDPVQNSLFVDIGGGTTDVCLVQGYFPSPDDQVSLAFAGDKVDALLNQAIRKAHPECALSLLKTREIKEQHAYVGKLEAPIIINVVVGGKMRQFDVGQQIGEVCTHLLMQIFEAVKVLITRASSDSVTDLLQNIILTGGGSRIRNIDVELQRLLTEDGYEQPRVRVVGERFKEFVASGAFKAACQAKENQWQQLLS